MAVPQMFKRARCSTERYEFWPSDLQRAGHTSVAVQDDEPLGRHLAGIGRHEVYGIHMARMQKQPCKLLPTSKFRNGAERWWCPVHQGSYGKKAQVLKASKTGVKCCDQSDALVDFVRSSEVLDLRLVAPGKALEANDYCELGIWIGLAPAIDTYNDKGKYFFAGFTSMHAKSWEGPK